MKDGGEEFGAGSIGIQHAAGGRTFWRWAVDTVVPLRGLEAQGTGTDRNDCMRFARRGSGSVRTRRGWRSF